MNQEFCAGQAFCGRIRFVDGDFSAYDRLYPVVGKDNGYIEILNVSSVCGKEWKLAMPSNMEIIHYDPPFPKRTFVKLDSFQRVSAGDIGNARLSRHGAVPDSSELEKIIKSIVQ